MKKTSVLSVATSSWLAVLAVAGQIIVPQVANGQAFMRMTRPTNDLLLTELIPNYDGTFGGVPFRTNQWGMHDKEYTLARPRNTYRMALIGSSMTVGAGVPQEQLLDALLEDQLNRTGPGAPARKYEILNFSGGAYGILQNVIVTQQKIFPFAPNAVLVTVLSIEVPRMRNYLSRLVKSGYKFPDAYVQRKIAQTGVDSTMQTPELLRRLEPISEDLVRWSYHRIVEICREKHVPVVGLVYPEPQAKAGREIDLSARLAAEAGMPLLDLRGVYAGLNTDTLRLRGTDPHWSVAGHKLIFERTYERLRDRDAELLKLGFSSKH